MINLMKWDLINVWKKTKGYVIALAVFVIFTIVFSKEFIFNLFPSLGLLNTIWPFIASVAFLIFFICSIITITFKMVTEARKETYLVELTADTKAWKLVLSKVIVNIMLIVILITVSYFFEIIMNGFATESTKFFTMFSKENYISAVIDITHSAIIIYFAYLLSKSLKFSRANPILWTIIFILLISATLGFIDTKIMSLCGVNNDINVVLNNEARISIDENLNDKTLYNNISLLIECGTIILFYFGSSKLLEKKFCM